MLVAFVNGLALFAIAAWIVYEAIERLETPREVDGGIMVVIAVLGLLVNIAAFTLLRGADRENLNVRARPSTCSAICSARWRRLSPAA